MSTKLLSLAFTDETNIAVNDKTFKILTDTRNTVSVKKNQFGFLPNLNVFRL